MNRILVTCLFISGLCLPVFGTELPSQKATASSTLYDFEAYSREASKKAMESDNLEGHLHRGIHSLKMFKEKFDGNKIKPKAFNIRLVRGSGYETALGFSLTKNWALNERDGLSVEARYSPYTLNEPYDSQRVHLVDFAVSGRRFLRPRFYAQAQIGVRHYKPNQAIRNFYTVRNQQFISQSDPYISFGLGYLLIKKLPIVHRPLVLAASYTISDDFRYPSIHPLGHTEFDPSGFSVGLKVGFKF